MLRPKKGVEKQDSGTAMGVAVARAIASEEFKNSPLGTDHLAHYFLPGHILSNALIQTKWGRATLKKKMPTGLYEYLIARTVYFDNIFTAALKEGIPQVVILGAGYDTRAFRFESLNRKTLIYELDIVTTQSRKMKCLQNAPIKTPQFVTFVPIDFQKEPIINALENAGFDNTQKTFFLWEGVSYYLDPNAVNTTLSQIRSSSMLGSTLAFDYAVSVAEEDLDQFYGAEELKKFMAKDHPDEVTKFTIKERELDSFLNQRGFNIIEHLNQNDIETQFLLKRSDTALGSIIGLFRFALATPI